ncbi:MAG TPA: hypothetical protein GX723_03575 [Thermoanaerobacterales bacterium]|jgi:hypothetical protein|nr:hypothetical protein [Thermoanaerobacterales bacterium]
MKKYKVKERYFSKIYKETKDIGALKGFFKSGENYVKHLNRKTRLLSRILEENNINDYSNKK